MGPGAMWPLHVQTGTTGADSPKKEPLGPQSPSSHAEATLMTCFKEMRWFGLTCRYLFFCGYFHRL